ncbi:MAG: hypothetical protein NTY47_04005 [Candidatus Omnitrophica bacterium]|nr:hypothetical protein [Candidatus Omnitrophota bacterium]
MRYVKILLLSLILSFYFGLEIDYAQNADIPRIDASQLTGTTVTSYMQDDIVPGKNLIYCSTFQLAWNQLVDDIIKAPIQLSDDPLIARMLNQRLTGKQDLSEDCYIAMAGLKKDGIEERINQALKVKFKTTPGIDISLQHPDDILAYAFLLKDLKFEKEFQNIKRGIMFNGDTYVEAFGIEDFSHIALNPDSLTQPEIIDYKDQVAIMDYKNDNDFVIILKNKSPDDELILAKISPGKTLIDTINLVINRITPSAYSKLRDGEKLAIPRFDLNILREYQELVNKDLLNKGFDGYFISKAIQSIRFKLNEKGAYLKSEAAIASANEDIRLRAFILNKPFLILLKQKGAKYPYFTIWVENAELLIKKGNDSVSLDDKIKSVLLSMPEKKGEVH